MKTSKIHFLFLQLLLTVCTAQAQVSFQKTYGSYYNIGFYTQQTSDGGYIVAGTIASSQIFLVKTDMYGDTVWTKMFHDPDYNGFYSYSAQQTSDGGYVLAGTADSSFTAISYVYLLKTDSYGDLVWQKKYGFSDTTKSTTAHSVFQTADSGFVITGHSSLFPGSQNALCILKTNSTGDTLWSGVYTGVLPNEIESSGRSIQQTSDGGYIVTGYIYNNGNSDMLLLKLNASGGILWAKAIGGSGDDKGSAVIQTPDGGYKVAGVTVSFGSGSEDIYVVKTDNAGNYLWSKTYGGASGDHPNYISHTPDGGLLITASTTSFGGSGGYTDGYAIKTDSLGNITWSNTFGGPVSESTQCGQPTSDGGFIISGHTDLGPGNLVCYLIKTDSTGNSGCNQAVAATITTSPATQISNVTVGVNNAGLPAWNLNCLTDKLYDVNTLCPVTGNMEIKQDNSITVQPNPAKNNCTITFNKTIYNGQLELLTAYGTTVFEKTFFTLNELHINTSQLAGGLYFIKLTHGKNQLWKKLVVEH